MPHLKGATTEYLLGKRIKELEALNAELVAELELVHRLVLILFETDIYTAIEEHPYPEKVKIRMAAFNLEQTAKAIG